MACRLDDYSRMLQALLARGYRIGPVEDYFAGATAPYIFLRHDVDRLVFRAVAMARSEAALNCRSTYFFRCDASMRFPQRAIRAVAGLGHRVGFHYETVVRMKGRPELVLSRFREELEALRRIADVATATAHGSPLSKLSNMGYTRSLHLADFGLIGDPAVNIDFSRVLYISDTGGIYGSRHNYRDWSDGKNLRRPMSPRELGDWLDPAAEPLVVISSHPERWAAGAAGFAQAALTDAAVNVLKFAVNRLRRAAPAHSPEVHAT